MTQKLLSESKFHKLIDEISCLFANARAAQVQFCWKTGRRIVLIEQDGDIRAAYGASLILKLAKVLTKKFGHGFSATALRKMRQFYLRNPIQPISAKLDWSDHVELLPIKDKQTRKRLQARIAKEDLNSLQIRRIVREICRDPQVKDKTLPSLKRPADLRLNTFCVSSLRTKLKDGDVLIDCGFFVSWPVAKAELKNLDLAETMSYTYAATIDRVIDGDTLLALIEVGFGIIVRDRLRLRGVNTPEAGTPQGDRAKKFVEKLLPAGMSVVIKSHKWKTDPHGRFVADVFYKEGVEDASVIIKDGGTYLNQELLDKGYAVRMEE